MAGIRRKGRIAALQVLYEVDCTGHPLEATFEQALSDRPLPKTSREMAWELVTGVSERRAHLDGLIGEHAPAWPVEQLSAVDRNILRIAIYEILFHNKTPPKAVINEAVELAKIFGSENLYRFVNGVLGAVIATVSA